MKGLRFPNKTSFYSRFHIICTIHGCSDTSSTSSTSSKKNILFRPSSRAFASKNGKQAISFDWLLDCWLWFFLRSNWTVLVGFFFSVFFKGKSLMRMRIRRIADENEEKENRWWEWGEGGSLMRMRRRRIADENEDKEDRWWGWEWGGSLMRMRRRRIADENEEKENRWWEWG